MGKYTGITVACTAQADQSYGPSSTRRDRLVDQVTALETLFMFLSLAIFLFLMFFGYAGGVVLIALPDKTVQ
jgi:hypothetical protein